MKPEKDNQKNLPKKDSPDSSDRDEAFVEQRLELLGQPESIDPKFVESLSARLDAEFAAAMTRVEASGDAETGTIAETNVDHNEFSTQQTSTEPVQRATPSVSKKRIWQRLSGGLVAATVLAVLFSFWVGQPLTTWAEMIEALKAAPWVQTDSGRTSSWFSASSQVVAMRDANQTVFVSEKSGTHFNYVQADGQIYQSDATKPQLPLDRDLIAWLAGGSQGTIRATGERDANWKMVSETAQHVDDATGVWLKLTVVFKSTQPTARTFTAVFTLNPETKLPVSCQIHQGVLAPNSTTDLSDHSNWQSVSFDYPADGPTDIFDLGVAEETPILQAHSDSEIGFVAADVKPDAELAALGSRSASSGRLPTKKLESLDPQLPEESLAHKRSAPATPTADSAEAVKEPTVAVKPKAATDAYSLPKTNAMPTMVPVVPIPAASSAMTARVDQLIEQLWKEKDITPVGQTNDEAFLRRVYLDVIGRVPTISEYDQFFELEAPTRRSELIDQLLDSREHALHMGGIWKRVLVPDDETAISRLGGAGKLEQWLADSFAENQPYDELVSELLRAEGRVNESGPLLFYAAAKMNAEELAARTSRSFLGMRLECAECHDHPFDEWSQEDFWGLAAYFAQISRPQGKIEMVSPVLRVRDADFGEVKLPETETVIEPSLPYSQHGGHGMTSAEIIALKNSEVTDGSRRAQLAAWVTHPQNSHFSQATVNRIWAHLFGLGIVNPVDDMGGHNAPISPQLLNQLGRYFVQADFDVRALMKVLLNSRAYQLSTENRGEKSLKEVEFFGRMSLKPLTAEQLYDCLATATGRTDLGSQVQMPMRPTIASNVDRFSDPGRTAFLAQFRTSIDQRTDYQAGIPQALTLMNGPMIASATTDAPKGILRSLSAPFFDDQTRVEKLFVATLSRKPTDEEQKLYADFFDSQPAEAQKSETLGDALWALLNSTEFTMNH